MRYVNMIILLTGVPGTGKDTIAKLLSKKGYRWISAKEIIEKKHLWSSIEKGVRIVEMKKLQKEIKKEIAAARKKKENVVIDGHLLCELKLDADVCIVLRTDPIVLTERLKKRGYPERKIKENIESELLDYCTQLAEKNLKKCRIYEVDSSRTVHETLRQVEVILKGKGKGFAPGWIDWSGYLKRIKLFESANHNLLVEEKIK
jgi:adenylate kinase